MPFSQNNCHLGQGRCYVSTTHNLAGIWDEVLFVSLSIFLGATLTFDKRMKMSFVNVRFGSIRLCPIVMLEKMLDIENLLIKTHEFLPSVI